jgi:hypothetical protein
MPPETIEDQPTAPIEFACKACGRPFRMEDIVYGHHCPNTPQPEDPKSWP